MSLLTRKYPFQQSDLWLRDSAVSCVIVFLILYLLQPFGFSMYNGNKFLVSLLFGAVTFGCCSVFMLATKPLCKQVTTWRIWHEALSVLALIAFIGICNFFVFSLVFRCPISFDLLLSFLYWTLIIGVIVTIFSVGISYYRYLRNQLDTLLKKTTEQQAGITITIHDTNVRGNDLQLPINDLLYIEAQKNNVSVCFVKDGKSQTAEIHTTLSAVLDDLSDYNNIFQCHRSFVVNLNNITSAQGNSNGYQLRLGNCRTEVPVSRTYVPKLRSFVA